MNTELNETIRGIFEVWYRNWYVFRKQITVNFLAPFIEPILYLAAIGYGIGSYVSGDVEGLPYVVFIAPAILAGAVMNASFFECVFGTFVRTNYLKTYDAVLATPITVREIVLGEIIWGATRSLLYAAAIYLVLVIMNLTTPGISLLVLPLSFLAGLLFGALAVAIAAIAPSIETLNYPAFLVIMPMYLLSGTFFPLSLLPAPLQGIALVFLPLTHLVALTREFMTGLATPWGGFHLLWLVVVTVLFSVLAVRLYERRLIV